MKSLILILVIVPLLSACAPGLYVNESKFAVQPLSPEEQADANSDIVVVRVTARLIAEKQKQQPTPVAKNNNKLKQAIAAHEYRIGPQDVLSITVWDHPELTIPAGEFRSAEIAGNLVRSDGTIYYPYIGVIKVTGKTLEEVRQMLSEKIKKYIVKPQLDVRVVSFRSQKVQVAGEVKKVGQVSVTDVPLTLLDAIHKAGGTTKFADLRNVSVTRGDTLRKFNVQDLYDYGDASQNVLLADGDIVHVPDLSQQKIFVLGEVEKPAAYTMHKGKMTLAEALGNAEGFDKEFANPAKIYVIRGEENRAKVYWLDAEEPDMLLLATSFQLAPQDVVYISTAKIAGFNRVMENILPSIQLLWFADSLTRAR